MSFSAAAQALAERSKACERSEGCHLLSSRGAALAPSGQSGPVPMICGCQCQWRTYGAARLRSHCAARGSRARVRARRKARCFFDRKRGSDCAATDSTWTFSRINGNDGSTSFRFTGFLRSPLSRSRPCAAEAYHDPPRHTTSLLTLCLPCASYVAGLHLRGINPKIKSGLNPKFQGRDAALRGLA